MHRPGQICLISGITAALFVLPTIGHSEDPDRSWRAGPIRYILTADEDRAYKRLSSSADRTEFIEQFWRLLDPTPNTAINERREEFWRRVDQANQLFRDSNGPGWKTDRGKVYVLLGPPRKRVPQGPSERWEYDALPRPEAPPGIMLHFHKIQRGEYRMSRDALEYRDPLAKPGGAPSGATFLAVRDESGNIQIAEDRIRMIEFPPARVETATFANLLEFRSRYDFYMAEKKATQVVFTVSVPPDQFRRSGNIQITPGLKLSMTIQDPEGGKVIQKLDRAMQLEMAASKSYGRGLLFQSSLSLRPGSYRVFYTLQEAQVQLGTAGRGKLEVPDFSRGLAVSSLVLAHPTGPEHRDSDPSSPVVVPTVPEPDPRFQSGDELKLAYQVYNARHHKGRADLTAEYRFFFRGGQELILVGQPVVLGNLEREALAYSLPLEGWPEGSYLVQIKVTDNHSRKEVRTEASFEIMASAPLP